jgi:hypothetical protein
VTPYPGTDRRPPTTAPIIPDVGIIVPLL